MTRATLRLKLLGPWELVSLTLAVFLADLFTPSGWVIPILYLVPLALSYDHPGRRLPVVLSAIFTVLVAIGFFLAPPGLEPVGTAFNRILITGVIWLFTIGMMSRKSLREQAVTAVADRKAVEGVLNVVEAERAQSEQGRRQSEQRFDHVVASIQDYAIYMLDPKGLIQSWNEGAERIEGYRADEIIGRHFSLFYRTEDQAAGHPDALLRAAAQTGRTEDEGWWLREDGTQFFADVVLTALYAPSGELTGYVTVLRDRTERNRLHEQFRLAVEAAPSGMVLTDEAGRIQLVNAQLESLFGYAREELLGHSVELLVPMELRDRHVSERVRFATSPQARPMGLGRTLHGRRKDGTLFPVEIGLNPIRTHEGLRVLAALVDITERQRLSDELKAREAMLATIIETEPECVTILNLDGTLKSMNRAGLAMIEAESERQVQGSAICRLVTAEWREGFDRVVRQAAEGGSGTLECELLGLRGTPHWVDIHMVPLRDPAGTVTGVLGVTRDVTARKHAEAALRQSEERARLALEAGQLGAWRHEWQTDVVELDAHAQAMYRCGARVSFDAMMHAVHPDDRPGLSQSIRNAHRPDAPDRRFSEEFRLLYPNGEIRWIVTRAQVYFEGLDSTRRAVSVIGISHDITDQREALEAVRTSEERFQVFMDHSPSVAYMKNESGRYVYMNKPLEELLGSLSHARPVEWEGKTDEELWPIESARQFRLHDTEVLAENRPMTYVETLPDEHGQVQQWLSSKFPLVDPQGTRHVAGVSLNVTAQKRLEEQLRRTERIAELGTLASGMAHEIGTPMNVILGRAEYLLQRATDDMMKKGLTTIVTQVERITRVMNQLLAFARRRSPERRAVDLRQTVAESVDIFRERFSHRRIEVETQLDDAVPMVRADPDQMAQVLINLIMNGVQAMPGGGTLRIHVLRAHQAVTVIVSDTGHGIPPEVVTKIFDPFFTTKDTGQGTGLGLTVVKGIIEEHGGTITVASEVHKGTAVTVSLPIDAKSGGMTS